MTNSSHSYARDEEIDFLTRRQKRFAVLRDTAPSEKVKTLWQLRMDKNAGDVAKLQKLKPDEVVHKGVVLKSHLAEELEKKRAEEMRARKPAEAPRYAIRKLPSGDLSVRAVRADWKLEPDEFIYEGEPDWDRMELSPDGKSLRQKQSV